VLLGAGTAMVYPTLLAVVGDVAHPSWRAQAVGIYRLWRDGGFAVGALLAGVLADLYSIQTAIRVVAVLTRRLRPARRRPDVRDPPVDKSPGGLTGPGPAGSCVSEGHATPRSKDPDGGGDPDRGLSPDPPMRRGG